MNGFGRLALVEGRLFLREKAALIGVFGLPVALVIGFGLIPGFCRARDVSAGQAPGTGPPPWRRPGPRGCHAVRA